MERTLPRCVMLTALFAGGCGAVVMRPRDRSSHQACVEQALRGRPDASLIGAAFASVSAACGDGELAACSTLGVMHEHGLATPVDPWRAAALYRLACEGGNAAGCGNLGAVVLAGDPRLAIDLLGRACEGRHAPSCSRLGSLYAEGGAGLLPDLWRAEALYTRGCHAGDARGCLELALLYERGVLGRDALRALTLYEQACAQGEARACEGLARMTEAERAPERRGPRPHPLEPRCTAGDAVACAAVGIAYHGGGLVDRDPLRASNNLQRACALGYGAACAVVGPMLQGSCMRGHAGSCDALARLADSH